MAEEEQQAEIPKKSKLPIILIVVVILLAALGGGAWFFLKGDKPAEKKKDPVHEVASTLAELSYLDLPEILVNLKSGSNRTHFLKLSLVLEFNKAGDKETVEKLLPRIRDQLQMFLNQLNMDDLNNWERLREEILLRVNNAIAPIKVSNVLYKDFLVIQ